MHSGIGGLQWCRAGCACGWSVHASAATLQLAGKLQSVLPCKHAGMLLQWSSRSLSAAILPRERCVMLACYISLAISLYVGFSAKPFHKLLIDVHGVEMHLSALSPTICLCSILLQRLSRILTCARSFTADLLACFVYCCTSTST